MENSKLLVNQIKGSYKEITENRFLLGQNSVEKPWKRANRVGVDLHTTTKAKRKVVWLQNTRK